MRLTDIKMLNEVAVVSSWIEDLEMDHNVVFMTLNSGNQYRILGVPEDVYLEWIEAPSKGKFWHSDIRGNYRVSRI